MKKYEKFDDALRVTRAVTRLTVYRPHQVRWHSSCAQDTFKNYSEISGSFLKKIEFFLH